MTSKPSKTLDDLTATQKEHIVRLFLEGEPMASSTTIAPSVIEDVVRDAFCQVLTLLQDGTVLVEDLQAKIRSLEFAMSDGLIAAEDEVH